MAGHVQKRRRADDEASRPKKKVKKVKKQKAYHSSSEDEDDALDSGTKIRASDAPQPKPVMKARTAAPKAPAVKQPAPKSILKQSIPPLETAKSDSDDDNEEDEEDEEGNDDDELQRNTALNAIRVGDSDEDIVDGDYEPDLNAASQSEDDDDTASDSETSETSSQAARSKKKRNDPDAFATSISKILGTKLSSSKRQDPLLSRSRSAAEANKSLADAKLELKAKAQIRAEKKQAMEKGRIKDVLGLDTADVDTGAIMEEEKRLKKTAQRGVVKLFNAVRAAQVKGEEAMRQARLEGVVGMQKREEKVNEMSKQGFLDLISSGGKKTAAVES